LISLVIIVLIQNVHLVILIAPLCRICFWKFACGDIFTSLLHYSTVHCL